MYCYSNPNSNYGTPLAALAAMRGTLSLDREYPVVSVGYFSPVVRVNMQTLGKITYWGYCAKKEYGMTKKVNRLIPSLAPMVHTISRYDDQGEYLAFITMEELIPVPSDSIPRDELIKYCNEFITNVKSLGSYGISHNDIKRPVKDNVWANLILTKNGIRLIDWGQSKSRFFSSDRDYETDLDHAKEYVAWLLS